MVSEWEIEETDKIKWRILDAKNMEDLDVALGLLQDLREDEDYWGFFDRDLDALFLEAGDEIEEEKKAKALAYLSLNSVKFIRED